MARTVGTCERAAAVQFSLLLPDTVKTPWSHTCEAAQQSSHLRTVFHQHVPTPSAALRILAYLLGVVHETP